MRTRVAIAVAIVAMLALAASAGATQSAGKLVTLHTTSLGKVLATSTGRTLYLYTPDPKNNGTCGCASTWPPLKTKGAPRAGMGVNKMLLGQTSTHQVTYNHRPLYTYSGDSAAGDTNGEGSGGVWFVVTAAGKKK